MSNYYCRQLNDDEDLVLLGFLSDDGTTQEALISMRYGANLCRYTYKGFNIIDYDSALLKTSDFTGTPVLYPTPNRVENGIFTFRGTAYKQIKRGQCILEHGLVYDEQWELLDVQSTEKEVLLLARISWTLDSPLFRAFPFQHSLTLTFRLIEGAIDIGYDIFNYGSEEIPFGFGLHPYFQKLSGEKNTEIELPVDQVMEATEALLPTGKIFPVFDTPFDLTHPTPIGNLDLDHVFLRAAGDKPAAIFFNEQGFAVYIHASDDFSHYVVYSPTGMPYFCIENQTCSVNAHNLYDRGLHKISGLDLVPPGEHKKGGVRYTISPEKSFTQRN